MLLSIKTSLPSALADGFKAPLLKKGGVGGGCISSEEVSNHTTACYSEEYFNIEF